MTNNFPLVSIIIVNFNGKKYLQNCLKGIFANSYPNCEVIACDNGSTDGSFEYLENLEGQVQVVKLGRNFGPAYARNEGVKIARGKYLAFLDNDTKPEKDWLKGPIREMEKDPTIGTCQCKLLLMKEKNRLDYAGDYLSQFGLLVQRVPGGEIDKGQVDQKVEILSAKSAAMVMKREAFDKAGGFDSDYFIYVEETDLAWRVWLTGFRIIFIPTSRVYHEFGTSNEILGDFQQYLNKFHAPKNYLTTLYKNLGIITLLKILPINFLLWFGVALWFLIKGQWRPAFWTLKGVLWFLVNLPRNTLKRCKIQKARVVNDKFLLPKIMVKQPLAYFFSKLKKIHKIGKTTSFYAKKKTN